MPHKSWARMERRILDSHTSHETGQFDLIYLNLRYQLSNHEIPSANVL